MPLLIDEFKYIKSRRDFFVALDEALKRTRALLALSPVDPNLASVLKQLEAIMNWTANGREPTKQERESLTVGRILVREFEPAQTDEIESWMKIVGEVVGYFDDWLDDVTFSTIDTDDMDDFD